METLTHLLGTGDTGYLVFAAASLIFGTLLVIVAVRTRPRRWRTAGTHR